MTNVIVIKIITIYLKSALETGGIVVPSAHYKQASLLVQLLIVQC